MDKELINKQIESKYYEYKELIDKLELDITLENWMDNANLRVYVNNIDYCLEKIKELTPTFKEIDSFLNSNDFDKVPSTVKDIITEKHTEIAKELRECEFEIKKYKDWIKEML
jgi:hypothetical protein